MNVLYIDIDIDDICFVCVCVCVCVLGESATHYLVKNTMRTFKELGVRAPSHDICA